MPDNPTPAGFAPDVPAGGRAAAPTAAGWRAAVRPPGRGTLLVTMTALTLAAAGGLTGLVVFWPTPPADPRFLSIPIGEYADPGWPVNPWCNQDAERLAERFRGRADAGKAFHAQTADLLRKLLAELADEAADANRPLVVHVSALAATRGRDVCLLTADSTPDDPAGWVPVSELLAAVGKHPAKHKLLLLDIARPVADPFNGVLRDDAAARLDALLRSGGATFPVLTSCGPGQVALPNDAAGHSAFAFHLLDGLGGPADGYAGGSRDGDITVRELAAFAAARVGRWATRTHGRPQTPTLYADPASDFVLARRASGSALEPLPPPAYPDPLRDLWAKRDAAGPADPVAVARFTAGLLRAEDRWRRPGRAAGADRAWQDAADRWQRAAVSALPEADADPRGSPRDRHAVARRGRPAPPEEMTKALSAYLSAKPEQETAAKKDWSAAAAKAPADAVFAVWALARSTDAPTPEQVTAWRKAADAADADPRPFAETRLLRRLDDRDFSRRRPWLTTYPAAAVAARIAAEDELGNLFALGADGFAAAAGDLEAGLAKRAAGDRRLALDAVSADADRDSDAARETAAVLAAAAADFRAAAAQVADRQAARRSEADTTAALADTLPPMLGYGTPDPADWFAVAAGRKSAGELRKPFAPEAVAARIGEKAPPRATLDSVVAVRALLAGPIAAGARKPAHDAAFADLAKVHEAVRELDAADTEAGTPTPPPTAAGDPESAAGLRRADAAIALLKRAGRPTADIEAKLQAVQDEPDDLTAWDALGTALRVAWLVDLPAATQAMMAAGQWADADRAGRTIGPAVARYRPWATAEPPAARPADKLAAEQEAVYRAWAAKVARP